jgi:uncharacterized repeat protein (TIGR03803 family)
MAKVSRSGLLTILISALSLLVLTSQASGAGMWNETVLHAFNGRTDGNSPSGLIFDAAGNLYGTASSVVFELSPTPTGWTETVLYTFTGGADGAYSVASLIFDAAGNLYGTTYVGGLVNDQCPTGCGVVFKLTPGPTGWSESVLYSFTSGTDGGNPQTALVLDAVGNLYGSTTVGGDLSCSYGHGCGVVFRLSQRPGGKWTETVLHTFSGKYAGGGPGGLTLDAAGNLYGTAAYGGYPEGNCFFGCGLVFKLTRNPRGPWKETVLYKFTGVNDGMNPLGPLTFDSAGSLYGVTTGGSPCDGLESVCGVVFQLSPQPDGTWKKTTLHAFTGWAYGDGQTPNAPLVFDSSGTLYGTTILGGNAQKCPEGVSSGCGIVFSLTPIVGGWQEKILYAFPAGTSGKHPKAGVILDSAGNLYGTTNQGGSRFQAGTVFQLSP